MVEHIVELSGKCDLIDELATQQVLKSRINAQGFEEAPAEPRTDAAPQRAGRLLAQQTVKHGLVQHR